MGDETIAPAADGAAPAGTRYDALRLDNQLCFPLYAASKEVTRRYKPLLDRIGLTYTQYIAMMCLWERGQMTVSELGERLYLDSGTLTPLLKKLEAKGLVTRERAREDERCVIVRITEAGRALEDEALGVPAEMGRCVDLTREEEAELYRLLHKVLRNVRASEEG